MIFVLLLFWLLCGVAAGTIYERKGRSGGMGFVGGLLLGPIGVVLAWAASPDPTGIERAKTSDSSLKKCPYCAEHVKREATVCRFCQRELPAA
jgi:hypothetical protein